MAQARASAIEFVKRWSHPADAALEICLFPSFVHLVDCVRERVAHLRIGAQDCSTEMEGAFTGEISARMLAELKVDYCLVGHSERRKRAYETPESLKSKLRQLILVGIRPVFCIGESLEERKSGRTTEVLRQQLEVLRELDAQSLILAYEPVWAIGTGLVASTQEISEAHAFIRARCPQNPILYGGSVKRDNAQEILTLPHVEGLLVGGASLQREVFEGICSDSLQKFR